MRFGEASTLLEQALAGLDIPDEVADQAVLAHDLIAAWLGAEESPLVTHSPSLYPQGSFRLGTPVRPLREEEFDIDLVCQLHIEKHRVSQKELKSMVGDRLRADQDIAARMDERRRCWTLSYEPHFHLDVLPCIPSGEENSPGVLLTDLELTRWQASHPIGYAEWFADRMRIQLNESRAAYALSRGVTIDAVPDWRIRTPLQRAVQMLKRHRDLYFREEDDARPVSIIITTLAAHAYTPQSDLLSAISRITEGMPSFIEKREGRYWVANPAHPNENFADKWNEDPRRRDAFLSWLDAVHRDLNEQAGASDAARSQMLLEQQLHVGRPSGPVAKAVSTGIAVPPAASLAHAKLPPWPVRGGYTCNVVANVHTEAKKGRPLHRLERTVSKKRGLHFRASTDAPAPYEIHWQVTNTGAEALTAKQLRGGFEFGDGSVGEEKWETTSYVGTHFVQAFVVKSGNVVARSDRIEVRIPAVPTGRIWPMRRR